MKKRHLFIAATALLAFASCADDGFVGDENAKKAATDGAISFSYELPNATRAESDHATSATNLGNQFIVWGEKNTGAADTKDKFGTGSLVFPNYMVEYTTNTAYTTTSNTKDWEYVGLSKSSNYVSNITYKDVVTPAAALTGSTEAQTIKYWDYNANSYTFTAVSASAIKNGDGKTDIENGYIKIQKNINDGTSPFNKGYLVQVYSGANLSKLYFSDRKVIEKTAGTDRNATNAYGGNVTLTFRNAISQVRAGVYETVPGYSISDISFKITGDAVAKVESDDAFGAICPNIKSGTYTEDLKVTYESEDGATKNHPIVTPVKRSDGTAAATTPDLILGTNINSVDAEHLLKTTAADPTWDTSGGLFTAVLPQAGNETNLKLKCSYTLYNSITGETINVVDKTAEVPFKYLQWKPNYKYTYLFKITDDNLYPITFDAIEIVNGDGNAEYITTVSEPCITTIGVKDGKYSVGQSEYAASTVVYATVMVGSSLATLNTDNTKLYTVTATDPFTITEASVAEAIIEKPAMTAAQVALAKVEPTASAFTGYQKTVPAEDGTTITLDASNNKAAYYTVASGTKYAIVYEKTAATYVWGTGAKYATSDAFNTAKTAAVDGKLYTDDQCTSEATWADADTEYYTANASTYATDLLFNAAGNVYATPGSVATPVASYGNSSTVYYKPIKVKSKGEYAIKVVNCPEVTP